MVVRVLLPKVLTYIIFNLSYNYAKILNRYQGQADPDLFFVLCVLGSGDSKWFDFGVLLKRGFSQLQVRRL